MLKAALAYQLPISLISMNLFNFYCNFFINVFDNILMVKKNIQQNLTHKSNCLING